MPLPTQPNQSLYERAVATECFHSLYPRRHKPTNVVLLHVLNGGPGYAPCTNSVSINDLPVGDHDVASEVLVPYG
jgi:hypothetical protein